MSENVFFKQKGPFLLSEIYKNINSKTKIFDIKSLNEATNLDITFFDSINYIH